MNNSARCLRCAVIRHMSGSCWNRQVNWLSIGEVHKQFCLFLVHEVSLEYLEYENKLRGWRSLAMKINLTENYETRERERL